MKFSKNYVIILAIEMPRTAPDGAIPREGGVTVPGQSRLEMVKEKIRRLYQTDPNIHISVTSTSPRIDVRNQPAEIVGVYKNIFRIKVDDNTAKHFHTLQYTDLLINKVKIREIGLP